MPVGTSDGETFKDRFEYLAGTPVPNSENNASAGSVGPSGGIVDDVVRPVPYGLNPPERGTEFSNFRLSKIIPAMAKSAAGAMTLPGDVLSGAVEPDSIQAIERATELAGLMVLGPAPVASKMAEGSLGSFAGVTSKTLPKDRLYKAQNMELDAVHPEDIFRDTGFFRGADNRWRYEIDDSAMSLKLDNMNYKPATSGQGWSSVGGEATVGINQPKMKSWDELTKTPTASDSGAYNYQTLKDIVDHPELFKAYPSIADTKVAPLPYSLIKQGTKGQVSGDTIFLAPGDPEYVKSVLAHEIQHMIQRQEGFARGGNSGEFLSPQLAKAEEELANIKKEIVPQIKEALKDVPAEKTSPGFYTRLVGKELNGDRLDAQFSRMLTAFKEEHPESYTRIKNILTSERLIKQHKDEAHKMYEALAGEVEARNVQARLHMGYVFRRVQDPSWTESVDRPLQMILGQNERVPR